MPTLKSTDVFIERSLQLLETNPSTTRISITYGSQSKKISKKLADKVTKQPIEDKSFVSFKVFDPVTGELHKLKTSKTKELSKILTALGPHGVQISKPIKKSRKPKDEDGDLDLTTTTTNVKSIPIRGFSSILTNSEIKQDEELETVKQADVQVSSNATVSSKKKTKKKSKR